MVWGKLGLSLFLEEKKYTFIQPGHIKLIKYYTKDIYTVTKDFCFK